MLKALLTFVWCIKPGVCKQEQYKTGNVCVTLILKSVHETIVAAEKQWVLHISVCVWTRARVCGYGCTGANVCLRAYSLTNPACNTPPYCHLRPLWLHHIFRNYLTNGKTFWEKLLKIKCVFWFSLEVLFKIFLILRVGQRDIVINVKKSSIKRLIILFGFW
jgi:hypothetical protein